MAAQIIRAAIIFTLTYARWYNAPMNSFEQPKKIEVGVEVPFAESTEVAERLVEKAHDKEINPDSVGIISHNMSAEVLKALNAAEENPKKGIDYAVDLARQLKERIMFSNEYFPDDAEKNESVKKASLECIEEYLEAKEYKNAA